MLVERLSPRWSSTGLTPFLGRPGSVGIFARHQGEKVLEHDDRFSLHQAPKHNGSSMESDFKPGTLRAEIEANHYATAIYHLILSPHLMEIINIQRNYYSKLPLFMRLGRPFRCGCVWVKLFHVKNLF
ncbi:hypothetical protein AVEN_183670-1 [Araneus ventricosus]|uniref:Uncharacterized protein n=1 Tax=Araneus ventricosus TaxID=182803 RepID=A0A4Y1ZRT3_ARAVE|nr:hypothetical protein AVEN_183670-1 [Araneus ventricosus]